jgi:hypothetical protein
MINARSEISRSFDPGSNVTVSIRDSRFMLAVVKRRPGREDREAGKQIDLSAGQPP